MRMLRTRVAAIVAGIVALGALLLAEPQGSLESGGKRSTAAGVYTASQASRGQVQYLNSCEGCHGPDLQGDSGEEIPALSGADFMATWNGKTVKELFEKMSRSMPASAPASLQRQDYVDVVAFILQANQLPPGKDALAADVERLDRIVIEKSSR